MASKNVNRTLLPRAVKERANSQEDDHLKQKQKISEQLKQKYIHDLQQRNRKLKNEIQKIIDLIEQNEQKQKEKTTNKTVKPKIGQTGQQNNPQLLKKQLQNVYKQIKNYERQIQKKQNNRAGSRISSDQIARLQVIRYQKLQHLQKLKNQLSTLAAVQVVNSKKLKNNMGRQHYQNLIVKMGDELKVLRQKLRGFEQKQKKKIANAKKQFQYIKKLQNQLVQSGVAMDQIQQMKRKNIYVQIKNIMNGQKDNQKPIDNGQKINPSLQQNIQQIVTFQKLQQMKNQVKLYKKLHVDYEKRLNTIQKQKQTTEKDIQQKKKIVEQKDKQIQKINQEINQVKQLVRKNNNIVNSTTGGQIDSIRKLQRKKSMDVNKSGSKNGDKKKSTIQK